VAVYLFLVALAWPLGNTGIDILYITAAIQFLRFGTFSPRHISQLTLIWLAKRRFISIRPNRRLIWPSVVNLPLRLSIHVFLYLFHIVFFEGICHALRQIVTNLLLVLANRIISGAGVHAIFIIISDFTVLPIILFVGIFLHNNNLLFRTALFAGVEKAAEAEEKYVA